ncbi:MAG: hypothetical protein R2724_17545 [Bryobacterales bacterium]
MRADGYEITYDDSDPIQHYAMWDQRARARRNRRPNTSACAMPDPSAIRR